MTTDSNYSPALRDAFARLAKDKDGKVLLRWLFQEISGFEHSSFCQDVTIMSFNEGLEVPAREAKAILDATDKRIYPQLLLAWANDDVFNEGIDNE